MFNTGLFVLEVQKRPCLWNVKDRSHSDRQVKLRAWEQIAKVFNSNSDSYSHKNITRWITLLKMDEGIVPCLSYWRTLGSVPPSLIPTILGLDVRVVYLTVDVLQRKWKHLRDYYIREKKRTSKAGTGTESAANNSVGRKRNSPLLEMLQFLDVDRGTAIVEITIERNEAEENFYSETNEEEDKSMSEYDLPISRPSKIQRIEIQQSNPLADDNEDSTDKQFLASLLPIIKNMSARERLKFRAQIMNPTPSQECQTFSINDEEKRKTPEHRTRPRALCKAEETEVVNKETKNAEAAPKRDEFTIYGEYVANKLRNIKNTHARHTAEFHINGILYKAEMGEYDIAARDVNTTRSGDSRESNNARIIESLMYEEDDSDDIIANVIKTEVLD